MSAPVTTLMDQASLQIMDSTDSHLREAVASATVGTVTVPYMVISDVLPVGLYAQLLETMPPPEAFDIADKTKANFDPSRTLNAPERSRETWSGFHDDVVDGLLTPILVEK